MQVSASTKLHTLHPWIKFICLTSLIHWKFRPFLVGFCGPALCLERLGKDNKMIESWHFSVNCKYHLIFYCISKKYSNFRIYICCSFEVVHHLIIHFFSFCEDNRFCTIFFLSHTFLLYQVELLHNFKIHAFKKSQYNWRFRWVASDILSSFIFLMSSHITLFQTYIFVQNFKL